MAEAQSLKRVLITGGNGGIGYAMCKLLALNHGCYVYMASRSVERGESALQQLISDEPNCAGKIELVQCDVSEAASIAACAAAIKEKLGEGKLYALVNNAGCVENEGCSRELMIATNVYGPKLMTEAFVPLIDQTCGRVVTIGSGGGAGWVASLTDESELKFWSSQKLTWEEVIPAFEAKMALIAADSHFEAYKLTKSVVHKWNEMAALANPTLMISAVSPGFVSTGLTNQHASAISPEDGCKSSIMALFNELKGSGFYYGSDGVRSPLHFMRNPGEPEFEGY